MEQIPNVVLTRVSDRLKQSAQQEEYHRTCIALSENIFGSEMISGEIVEITSSPLE